MSIFLNFKDEELREQKVWVVCVRPHSWERTESAINFIRSDHRFQTFNQQCTASVQKPCARHCTRHSRRHQAKCFLLQALKTTIDNLRGDVQTKYSGTPVVGEISLADEIEHCFMKEVIFNFDFEERVQFWVFLSLKHFWRGRWCFVALGWSKNSRGSEEGTFSPIHNAKHALLPRKKNQVHDLLDSRGYLLLGEHFVSHMPQ